MYRGVVIFFALLECICSRVGDNRRACMLYSRCGYWRSIRLYQNFRQTWYDFFLPIRIDLALKLEFYSNTRGRRSVYPIWIYLHV